MPKNQVSRGVAKAFSLICALLAGCGVSSTEARHAVSAEPDRVERHGDIEIVIHTRHDRSANYDSDTTYESWSLRWRGQPLAIDSLGGMFLDQPLRTDAINAVFVLGGRERPDLLVNVGDPNNASVFHLLRQEPDGLAAPVLCKAFGGDNPVRVLDGQDGGQVFMGPNYRSLVGARRLLLGSACIYDTGTGEVLAMPDKPRDVHLPSFARAMALSPGGRMFARVGLSETEDPVVMVADLDRGTWSRLPIDPRRMRYPHFEEIDAAWLDHHFQWRHGADGRDSLVVRPGFKPLPWRGYFSRNAAQYDVRAAEVDSSEQLGTFLVRRFQAKRLPGEQGWREGGLQYEVEQEVVNVTGAGFFIAQGGKPYWPGQPGDPERQKQLIHRIGEAFDAELAAGLHDAMFVAMPEAH